MNPIKIRIPATRGPHLRAFLQRQGLTMKQAAVAVPGVSYPSLWGFCAGRQGMLRLNVVRVMGAALNIAAYRDDVKQRALARQEFAKDRGAE